VEFLRYRIKHTESGVSPLQNTTYREWSFSATEYNIKRVEFLLYRIQHKESGVSPLQNTTYRE
jgi:hypothetical protein